MKNIIENLFKKHYFYSVGGAAVNDKGEAIKLNGSGIVTAPKWIGSNVAYNALIGELRAKHAEFNPFLVVFKRVK